MQTDPWRDVTIADGEAARLRIGPLTLVLTRNDHGFGVTRENSGDPADRSASFETLTTVPEPSATAVVERYATPNGGGKLSVVPVVPDRSVVTELERPLTISPGTEVTLYVGSPVWARLVEPSGHVLAEFPAWPPKETWFGPNTRDGELCYATRTPGRLEFANTVTHAHRMTTAVCIANGRDEPLVVESVNLPVRRLSVYRTENGRLWTEAVTLERTGRDVFATVNVKESPPREAASAVRLSGPRDSIAGGGLFRAFGTLFS
jgi:hypothetical protein